MALDSKKIQNLYGIRLDSPKTIETCLALGINPNIFTQQILNIDYQDSSLSQSMMSFQQQKLLSLSKEVLQTRERMIKLNQFLFMKDPILIKKVKKQLEDPEIAHTFDFSRLMKDYLAQNKQSIMKLFKKDENKNNNFSLSNINPETNYLERQRLSLERNQKLQKFQQVCLIQILGLFLKKRVQLDDYLQEKSRTALEKIIDDRSQSAKAFKDYQINKIQQQLKKNHKYIKNIQEQKNEIDKKQLKHRNKL